MIRFRVWLFRFLVLVATGYLLVTWFMPWWQAFVLSLEINSVAVVVRPWTLENYVPADYAYMVIGAEMPVWFAPLMWIYLGLCIAALLFSLFAREKRVGLGKFRLSLPQALIGGVGLSYIVIVALAVTVIAIRAADFYGASVSGSIVMAISEFEKSNVETSLLLGYWLACGVGPLLILLALFRNKIIGKPKLIT
jgi:hypothetical protein